MLSKCANPACTAAFHYLREGKLFQFDAHNRAYHQASEKLTILDKPAHKIEYFWLCGRCSAQMTLNWDPHNGIITVPLPSRADSFSASAS